MKSGGLGSLVPDQAAALWRCGHSTAAGEIEQIKGAASHHGSAILVSGGIDTRHCAQEDTSRFHGKITSVTINISQTSYAKL
jgi:hypothetical protein